MNRHTVIEHRAAPKTQPPISAYGVTNLAIEICKLRNLSSDQDIKDAVNLAKDILLQLEADLQPKNSETEPSQ